MQLIEKLNKIQKELKAPKNQKNSFGNYNYRSCEDILEAVKPLIPEDVSLVVRDDVVEIGGRIYVKATAELISGEEKISGSGFAREAETKKGMDESQITGAASSYARKYALNGLFLIDDTKDADFHDNTQAQTKPASLASRPTPVQDISMKQLKEKLVSLGANTEEEALRILGEKTGVILEKVSEIDSAMAKELLAMFV